MRKLATLAALAAILTATFAPAAQAQTPVRPFLEVSIHAPATGDPIPSLGGGGTATLDAFTPTGNATRSVSTASASVDLGSTDNTALVQNLGSVTAYVAFGSSWVTATTSSTPVAPGMAIAFDAGANTHIAAISASGTTNLAITTGTGIPTFGLAIDNTSPVPVTDNGGSITVDGSVSLAAAVPA